MTYYGGLVAGAPPSYAPNPYAYGACHSATGAVGAAALLPGSPSKAAGETAAPSSAWTAVDDGRGNVYYWNSATATSQWEVPQEWMQHRPGPAS
eukprot:5629614-Pyramimonas_sp.AAC.1